MPEKTSKTNAPEMEAEVARDEEENVEDRALTPERPPPPSYYYDDACGYEVYIGEEEDEET